MVEPLNELARITGDDFRVTPIPGFGSYQSGSTASGSTATGGGHIDIYLTKATPAKRVEVRAKARMIGFYADIRMPKWYSKYFGRWLTASWAPHLHMLLKDDVHLSAGALAQLKEWYRGENGLAGGDLDDGPRDYLHQTWAGYKAGRTPSPADPLPTPPKTVTVKRGDTLAKIAAALGVSLAAVVLVNPQIKDPSLIQPGQTINVPAATATKAPVKVTPKPTPKPTVKVTPKPAPKPVVKKPVAKPVVKKPVAKPAKAARVDASKLHKGVSSRHVTAYQKALRAYLGKSANSYNPAGATGFYGAQTEAMTKAVYRDLSRKQPHGGWTRSATEPGPGLLKVLGLR